MNGASPGNTAPIWGARLARILERQRDLCVQLDAMSARQGEIIASGDTDALLGLLGQRQTVVDEVAALGAELEPLKSVWEAEAWRLSPDQRGKIASTVEEIGRLMERIGQRDEAARADLEARRAGVARELSELSRGRGAVAAYGSAARRDPGPAYEDRRG